MTKPLKIDVQIGQWFSGQGNAGLPFLEWQRMTPREKLAARMAYISAEAERLGAMTYHEGCGIPGNLIAEARHLHVLAEQAIDQLQTGNLDRAAMQALDVGIMTEGVNRSLAIWAALQLKGQSQRAKSAGGAATADQRKIEQAERMAEVVDRWNKLSATPEHDRAGIIAARLGIKIDTVRRLVKKAGLR